jgi:hypothetical protein
MTIELQKTALFSSYTWPLLTRKRILAAVVVCVCSCGDLLAAAPVRVFVESFGDKPGAMMLHDEFQKLLGKQSGIAIVGDAAQADYIVTGTGETYVKGYVGTNPRVRYLNSDAQPVYGGYLSLELKPPGRDTIWSYLVTPRRMGPQDVYSNLTSQMVSKLADVVRQQPKP